jgi:hypothetical protein
MPDASWFWISDKLPDPVLGEVEWLYECEECPGDREPVRGIDGAASAMVRAEGGTTANGFGGGIMVLGDPPLDPDGEVRMVWVRR